LLFSTFLEVEKMICLDLSFLNGCMNLKVSERKVTDTLSPFAAWTFVRKVSFHPRYKRSFEMLGFILNAVDMFQSLLFPILDDEKHGPTLGCPARSED